MGVAGSALATTMARTLEIIVILGYLLLYDRKIKFRLKYLFKSDRLIFREYMKVGAPVIISDFILVVGMSMLSVIMGHMGSEMVAANSITNVLTQLTTVLQFQHNHHRQHSWCRGYGKGPGLCQNIMVSIDHAWPCGQFSHLFPQISGSRLL
jgi:hypothetical protein